MPRSRPRFRPPPGRKLEKFTTCLMPSEVSPSCRQLVKTISGALARWGSHVGPEDRAAACLLVAFGEIARLHPSERDDFIEAAWRAGIELIAANSAANAKQNGQVPDARV